MPKESQEKVAKFSFHGQPAELKHGSVVIAAITSCTNTSNPSVMLGAGLVAKKACKLGLQVSHVAAIYLMFQKLKFIVQHNTLVYVLLLIDFLILLPVSYYYHSR